ncbi:unnamed protein product [Vitrella brassicaformis CCMP3155]|uniref:Uncharacterized protein n=1 Tax=Vitrella brassicaformis (strain CCMP3155) TaxID=1169540 RepID=A0A0G4H3T3_VITBC|nr:unnamed protein product [Vitrella brassicaformis CCMP3155]|eukprot:CEM38182.1 unnamed protein product [Vitrella brassicaformis CCMP3155]
MTTTDGTGLSAAANGSQQQQQQQQLPMGAGGGGGGGGGGVGDRSSDSLLDNAGERGSVDEGNLLLAASGWAMSVVRAKPRWAGEGRFGRIPSITDGSGDVCGVGWRRSRFDDRLAHTHTHALPLVADQHCTSLYGQAVHVVCFCLTHWPLVGAGAFAAERPDTDIGISASGGM